MMKHHESRIYASLAERLARPISLDSKLASLDVLRGIAIISVLIAHFWPVYLPAPRALTILFGQFGVTLFFFLSGFLMDRTYSDEPQLIPFFIRRTMRILPMYWISILLIFATEHGWTLRDIASNAIFVTGPMHVVRMSGVFWTLYIEVLFYATVPLLFFAGRPSILMSSYIAIGLSGALWTVGIRSGVASHYLAYCYLGLQFGAWRRKVIAGGAVLCSLTVVTVAASVLPIVSPFTDIVSPFFGLAPPICAVLLYYALRFSFRARPVEFFGHISYSLYLLHSIVFSWLVIVLARAGYASWIAAGIIIGLSVALSTITLFMVERPGIAVAKQIVRRFRLATSATAINATN
jgi:peptidoglycan/LPS O-acetylase OafA/YrhL